MNRRALLRSAGALAAGCATGGVAAGAVAFAAPIATAEPTADPCLAFVTDWRTALDMSVTTEGNAFYERHVKPFEEVAAFGVIPGATSARGALSALQMVLSIAEREGEFSPLEAQDANLIRAALAYLEGAAS